MIWGLIASCLLCNRPQPMDDVWGETGFRWETGSWETGQDSGCDPWIALRDDQDVAVVALDFGEVQGQETRTLSLVNRIEDCGTLRVSEIRVEGDSFALESGSPTTLEPQESVELTVRFDPAQAGPSQGSLVILSNDPFYPELTVPLSGTLATLDLVLDPSVLHFQETLVLCESTAGLSVENVGADPVSVLALTLPEPFSLDTELPLSLEAGESATLDLRFAPLSKGVYGGTLTLESQAGKLSAELSASAALGESLEEESLATGARSAPLGELPWEETLSVRVSGVRVDTWVYVAEDNSVLFDEDSTPDAGARLSLSYVPVSSCEG